MTKVLILLAVLVLFLHPGGTTQLNEKPAAELGSSPRRLRGSAVDQLKRDIELADLEQKLQRQRDAMMSEHDAMMSKHKAMMLEQSFTEWEDQLAHEKNYGELERLVKLKSGLRTKVSAPVFSEET